MIEAELRGIIRVFQARNEFSYTGKLVSLRMQVGTTSRINPRLNPSLGVTLNKWHRTQVTPDARDMDQDQAQHPVLSLKFAFDIRAMLRLSLHHSTTTPSRSEIRTLFMLN